MSANIPIRSTLSWISQGFFPKSEDATFCNRERGIFVVADGFGGPKDGLEAAELACQSIREFLEKEAGDVEATLPFVIRKDFSLAGNVLFNAIIHANKKLIARNKKKHAFEKGGASVLAGYLDGDLAALATVGNCRSFLMREGQENELTTPRCYSLLESPMAREWDASLRTVAPLTALGISDDLEPEICEYRVKPGDWLMLQTRMIQTDIRRIILSKQTLQSLDLVRSELPREGIDATGAVLVVGF